MEGIVAVYDDWGIGRDGTQPVALSADRKFFRETTRLGRGFPPGKSAKVFLPTITIAPRVVSRKNLRSADRVRECFAYVLL